MQIEEKPPSRKSSSDSKKEKIEEEVEYTNSEINKELDKEDNVEKYDVSEANENDFIYKLYKRHHDIFILEDKEIKDRNNVKNLLTRYIFSLTKGDEKKFFNASVKAQKSLKSQTKKNCNLLSKIHDYVEPSQVTSFWNLQRFKEELKFVSKDDIIISIGFQ